MSDHDDNDDHKLVTSKTDSEHESFYFDENEFFWVSRLEASDIRDFISMFRN